MKKQLFICLSILICSLTGFAQNYYTGFDTPAERNQWTIYRLGSVLSSNWNFTTGANVSAPYSVNHDYPMDGPAEDWLVSPKIYFTGNSSKITLHANRFAYSSPPSVYYGIWISFGSKIPDSGNYAQLVDLTLFPTEQNVWHDTTVTISLDITDSNLPIYADSAYIAIKYKAYNYAWLMIGIDNITIDSATTSIVSDINNIQNLETFKVFPNPVKDNVFILKKDFKNTYGELLNMEGQIMQSFALKSEQSEINIKDLKSGFYILKLTDDKQTSCKKILKL